MKQTIRFNTFETNSSSTHSLIIIPDKYYKDWNENKLFYLTHDWSELSKKLLAKNNNCEFFTKEFLMNDEDVRNDKYFPKREKYDDEDDYEEALEYFFRDSGLITSDMFFNNDMLEADENIYTTESGETIHILCQFGYDS